MAPSKSCRVTMSSVGVVVLAMLGCGAEPRNPPGPQSHDKPVDAATADLRLPALPPSTDAGAPPGVGPPPSQERPPSAGCVVHTGEHSPIGHPEQARRRGVSNRPRDPALVRWMLNAFRNKERRRRVTGMSQSTVRGRRVPVRRSSSCLECHVGSFASRSMLRAHRWNACSHCCWTTAYKERTLRPNRRKPARIRTDRER